MDPRALALSTAVAVAEDPARVGDFVDVHSMDDGVSDYRFVCLMPGYEGWQWSVTLFHDADRGVWTVDESSLVPTDKAILSPEWTPWKDRLRPSDLSVTDVMGTLADDPRLEPGVRQDGPDVDRDRDDRDRIEAASVGSTPEVSGHSVEVSDGGSIPGSSATVSADEGDGIVSVPVGTASAADQESDDGMDDHAPSTTEDDAEDDLAEAIDRFSLARNRVLSPQGRSQTADRWYHGPHGPKSMSTRIASGNPCSTCGFLVHIQGDLGLQFGVCANMWSPDDGRVVSLDHGCGEHSQIEPPESPHLWVQSKPAYDDIRIDVIDQRPREESAQVEMLEQMEDGDAQEPSTEESASQESLPQESASDDGRE